MKKILLGGLALLFVTTINAQGWMSQGARSLGLANSGVTFVNALSYHHNPGALGFLEKGSVGISYQSRYALKELQTQGVAIAVPLKVGVISAGGQFYGYDAYRTTRAGVGYSMKLGQKISAGVQINYLGMRFGSSYYGRKDGVSAELGALAKINEKVSIGFSVMNLSRSKLAEYTDERWGTLLRLGVSYQVIEQLLLIGEIEAEIGYMPRLRAGIEYHPIDLLYIRVGAQGAPMDFSFGFGFDFKGVKLDLATQYNQILGWTPGVSLMVDFYNPEK